jgi:hypothetical protein
VCDWRRGKTASPITDIVCIATEEQKYGRNASNLAPFGVYFSFECPLPFFCFPLDTDFEKGYTKVVRHLVNLKKSLARQRKVSLQENTKPREHRDTLQCRALQR